LFEFREKIIFLLFVTFYSNCMTSKLRERFVP
jgi:hypothetical protein